MFRHHTIHQPINRAHKHPQQHPHEGSEGNSHIFDTSKSQNNIVIDENEFPKLQGSAKLKD